jgi:hypothetical protein
LHFVGILPMKYQELIGYNSRGLQMTVLIKRASLSKTSFKIPIHGSKGPLHLGICRYELIKKMIGYNSWYLNDHLIKRVSLLKNKFKKSNL